MTEFTRRYLLSLKERLDLNPKYVMVQTHMSPYTNSDFIPLETFLFRLEHETIGDDMVRYVIAIWRRIE